MNLCLEGKRVLVTGSSNGIGLAIAQAFYSEKSIVVSNGRDKDKLSSSFATDKRRHGVAGDVTNPEDALRVVNEAIAIMGGIDILICNVGSGKSAPPGSESYSDWQKSLSINLLSTTNMVESALPELKKSRGVIVCISSICGVETIYGAPLTYSAAKAALNSYIRGISVPIGKDGVRINGVAPGNILFKGSVWDEKYKKNPEAVNHMLSENVPLNRLGNVDDIVNLVLLLSSPKGSFNSGSIYICDGGQTRS